MFRHQGIACTPARPEVHAWVRTPLFAGRWAGRRMCASTYVGGTWTTRIYALPDFWEKLGGINNVNLYYLSRTDTVGSRERERERERVRERERERGGEREREKTEREAHVTVHVRLGPWKSSR